MTTRMWIKDEDRYPRLDLETVLQYFQNEWQAARQKRDRLALLKTTDWLILQQWGDVADDCDDLSGAITALAKRLGITRNKRSPVYPDYSDVSTGGE